MMWVKVLGIMLLCLFFVERPSFASLSLSIKETDHNFFSQEEVRRTIILSNNLAEESEVLIRWRTVVFSAVIQHGEERVVLGPNQEEELKITLKMPNVRERVSLVWKIKLFLGGEEREEEIRYSVFPRMLPIKVRKDEVIGLFDPNDALKDRVIGERVIDLESRRGLYTFDYELQANVAIIGPYALSKSSSILSALERKVREEGLTVICLEQEEISPRFSIPVRLTSIGTITSGRIKSPGHPILAGLREEDLKCWRRDGVISRFPLQKPNKGNFRTIVDSGDNVLLLEVPYGRGRFIFSQLLVGKKIEDEPVAQLLFANLIKYGMMEKEGVKEVGIFGTPKNRMMRLLDSLGVVGPRNPNRLDGLDLVVVCLDETFRLKPEFIHSLYRFTQGGGKLLIFNLTPHTLYPLKEVFPKEVSLKEYSGEGMEVGPEASLLWGVSNDDLETFKAEYGLYFMEDQEAKVLIRPNIMATFKRGMGKVIVCQIQFQEDEKSFYLLSQILTGLGGLIESQERR
jgi:hypothetical protein